MSRVADELHPASVGQNLLASQIRSAIAAYGAGIDFYAALADVAAAADLEELDDLAVGLRPGPQDGQGRAGCPRRARAFLREAERNRLFGPPRRSSRSWPASSRRSICRCSSS
ncbi:MAG: hypothetical protein M5T61_09095 [Acidimicrobiia bacterium]|nr:hypothetical protein [Acidimicrobiia bacterium]